MNDAEFEVYIASDEQKEGYSQYTIDGKDVYLKLYDTTKAITGTADINGDGTKDDGRSCQFIVGRSSIRTS